MVMPGSGASPGRWGRRGRGEAPAMPGAVSHWSHMHSRICARTHARTHARAHSTRRLVSHGRMQVWPRPGRSTLSIDKRVRVGGQGKARCGRPRRLRSRSLQGRGVFGGIEDPATESLLCPPRDSEKRLLRDPCEDPRIRDPSQRPKSVFTAARVRSLNLNGGSATAAGTGSFRPTRL